MNGVQQRERQTAVHLVRLEMEALAKAWDAELAEKLAIVATAIREEVGKERTHRLKLAEEQRSYVDRADLELRLHTDLLNGYVREDIEKLTFRADDVFKRVQTFENLTFWGRLHWLFTGRR